MSEISEERMEEIRNTLLEADEDGLGELRLWLFKESCRIESRERQLDEMKGHLERERETLLAEHNQEMAKLERERESLWEKDDLAEQKLEMLRDAYDRLDNDRQRIDRERKQLEKEKAYNEGYYNADSELFFAGVNSQLAIKKRYKDLIKIFHPDNLCGDARALQMINQEYEYLCRQYQMKA